MWGLLGYSDRFRGSASRIGKCFFSHREDSGWSLSMREVERMATVEHLRALADERNMGTVARFLRMFTIHYLMLSHHNMRLTGYRWLCRYINFWHTEQPGNNAQYSTLELPWIAYTLLFSKAILCTYLEIITKSERFQTWKTGEDGIA